MEKGSPGVSNKIGPLAYDEQEDARRRLRGMCGFKKELRVCWMEMEVE